MDPCQCYPGHIYCYQCVLLAMFQDSNIWIHVSVIGAMFTVTNESYLQCSRTVTYGSMSVLSGQCLLLPMCPTCNVPVQ